ncbi:MAG: VIT1/CCC1 transporter family protein [Candidatus Micrarchaeota archaeon]
MSISKKQAKAHILAEENQDNKGTLLRQIILGGQDGLVNVLGIVLGLAAGTGQQSIVILGGLAATFAESVSMAAVAYTSAKAQRDYYFKEVDREKFEIKNFPEVEREEIRLIYMKKGFRGKQLEKIVDKICKNEKLWLDTMMADELRLSESKDINPISEGVIVGIASFVGSLLPLIAFFFFLDPRSAIIPSILFSVICLFAIGAYKGKTTLGSWWKSGIEMSAIGMAAAIIGYAVGMLVGGQV